MLILLILLNTERKLDQIVPFERENVRLRYGMFLGHREDVLAVTGRVFHLGWIRRWVHEEPDVRGGVLWYDWAHGSGASRLRPDRDFLRRFVGHVFHQPRPDARHATRQRRRDAIQVWCVLQR